MSEISKDEMKNVTYRCCVALEDTAMDVDRRRFRSINGTALGLWKFQEKVAMSGRGRCQKFPWIFSRKTYRCCVVLESAVIDVDRR